MRVDESNAGVRLRERFQAIHVISSHQVYGEMCRDAEERVNVRCD